MDAHTAANTCPCGGHSSTVAVFGLIEECSPQEHVLAALCASMLASSRISSKDKTSSPSLLLLAGEGISLILLARSAQR